jgi:hypothetical protein
MVHVGLDGAPALFFHQLLLTTQSTTSKRRRLDPRRSFYANVAKFVASAVGELRFSGERL